LRKGVIIGISLFVVIISIIGIVNGWNNVQNAQNDVKKATADVIKTCQDEKAAMLNPDLPTDAYQNNLAHFNEACTKYVGALR
jgi:predicted negative regulator of RcsB-dependent stress response